MRSSHEDEQMNIIAAVNKMVENDPDMTPILNFKLNFNSLINFQIF